MKVLKEVDKLVERAERVMVAISWGVTLFITFMVVIDVFLRYFFNKPLPASWEISEVIMPYIVFFALSRALVVGAHVKVTIITNLLSERKQRILEKVSLLICIIMCLPLTWWSWLRFIDSFRIREEILAAIRIPWWVGKFAMPMGLAIFALRYLLLLFNQQTVGIGNSE